MAATGGMQGLTSQSAKVRKARREAKQALVEQARLGTKARLAQLAEDLAGELAVAFTEAVRTGDQEALRRAQAAELLLSRVYGRPTQPTQDVTPNMPTSLEDLARLTPEERRELLRALPD